MYNQRHMLVCVAPLNRLEGKCVRVATTLSTNCRCLLLHDQHMHSPRWCTICAKITNTLCGVGFESSQIDCVCRLYVYIERLSSGRDQERKKKDALLAVYKHFGLAKAKHSTVLLFIFACVCVCVYVSHSLSHSLPCLYVFCSTAHALCSHQSALKALVNAYTHTREWIRGTRQIVQPMEERRRTREGAVHRTCTVFYT